MKSKVLDSKHMVKFHHNYEMASSCRFLQTKVEVNLSEEKKTDNLFKSDSQFCRKITRFPNWEFYSCKTLDKFNVWTHLKIAQD